jgi:hypothetical protein
MQPQFQEGSDPTFALGPAGSLPNQSPSAAAIPMEAHLPAVQGAGASFQGTPEPVIANIGTITVTQTRVYTPTGDFNLLGSTWRVQDSTHTKQVIPGWAIALAIVLSLCTLGLSFLFLLVHETRYLGAVEVTAANEGRQYTARIPISDQATVQAIFNQVNWMQSLAGQQ